MSQTPESASLNDIVYAVVDCTEGHETVGFLVGNQTGDGISLVFCPVHRKILNLHSQVAIKAWVTEQELRERGFDIKA